MALPAMRAGAAQAGHPVPPLIAHAPVCVHEHAAEVRAAVRQQVRNPRLPFYQRMLIAAGFPEAAEVTWSDAMIDAIVCWGEETRVAERLQDLFACGATEVLLSQIGAAADPAASVRWTMRLVAELARMPGP